MLPGTTLRSPELADTLTHVGRRGWADLYTGDLAEQIVTDMARRGGLVTAADLSGYVARERTALLSTLRGWCVAANPPPSIGGPVLSAMLLMLARREGHSADDVIRIQREVLGYRRDHLDVSADLLEAGRGLIRTVTEQNPAPGTELKKGETLTITVVALQPGQQAAVTVPNVTGWNYPDAERELLARGLRINRQQQGFGERVNAQNPPGDQQVAQGTEITLWVG